MQIVSDGVKHEDSQIIADVFGSYFDTVVYKQLKDTDTDTEFIFNKDSFKSSLSIGPTNDIIYTPVTGKQLKEIFKSLQNKKCSCWNSIEDNEDEYALHNITPCLYM
jgi:hypothetical protein